MHIWGDDWFKEHGDNLYKAIEAIENRIHKWAHAGVYGKEKYGTYRDEYFQLWDGGLFQIIYGYRLFYGQNWFSKLLWKIDHNFIPIKKTKFGWLKAGLSDFNYKIGLTKLVWKWQAKMVNKAFQVTCKEYPDVIEELIIDADCYQMIKPCKWGDVDGEAIHKKYWKKIEQSKELEKNLESLLK